MARRVDHKILLREEVGQFFGEGGGDDLVIRSPSVERWK